MRSKAPLALMEQAVMVLVFALAAALCLRVFVWSDQTSKRGEARDRAAVAAQSAAEIIKHEGEQGGDMASVLAAAAERLGTTYGAYGGEGAPLELHYHTDWTLSQTREYAYCLKADAIDSGVSGLNKARVQVIQTDSADVLFEIEVAWQTEVERHG